MCCSLFPNSLVSQRRSALLIVFIISSGSSCDSKLVGKVTGLSLNWQRVQCWLGRCYDSSRYWSRGRSRDSARTSTVLSTWLYGEAIAFQISFRERCKQLAFRRCYCDIYAFVINLISLFWHRVYLVYLFMLSQLYILYYIGNYKFLP